MELIAKYYESPIAKPIIVPIELGTSIDEIIDLMELPNHARELIVVTSGDQVLEGDYVVLEDQEITIGVTQGKQVIAVVATIAVAVIAPYLAPVLLAGMGIAATALTVAIATAAITMVGSLVIGALIPPPSVKGLGDMSGAAETEREQADDTFFVTGSSNQAKLFQHVPSVYGTHKMFPDLAATTRVSAVGVTSDIALLLDCGLGNVVLRDIRVGETPIGQLGLNSQIHTNTSNPNLRYIADLSAVQQFNAKVTPSPTVVTSSENTTKLQAVFQFPRGLVLQNTDGTYSGLIVSFECYYRKVGSGGWIRFTNVSTGGKASFGTDRISGKSLEPFVVVANADGLSEGRYEVKVSRNTAQSTDPRRQDGYTLIQLKSYKRGNPVDLDRRHTLIEIQGIASDKLAGQIQTLNLVASRKVRDISNSGFGGWIESSNPALIAIDILTCEENPQPLRPESIDFATFNRLKGICASGKYTFNGVVRTERTVKDVVNNVLSNARAQLNMQQNGKIGVLIDEAGRSPRQMITPANSWDFSGSRTFPVYPHALRLTYTEPAANWQSAEVIAYDDGYNAANADTFEDMPTVGVTNRQEAWRFGRFMIAQARMRNETFTVKMDIEYLAVVRGDIVTVQHDVPKFGGIATRVVSVDSAGVATVDQIMVATGSLGARIRKSDGTILTEVVASAINDKITFNNPVPGLDHGDLVVVGELGRETRNYIVLGIDPDASLSATLTLVPYVEAVYTADAGTVPDWDPGFGPDLIGETDLEIVAATGEYEITHENRRPFGEVSLHWTTGGTLATLAYYNVIAEYIDGSFETLSTTDTPFFDQKIDLLENKNLYNTIVEYTITPVNILGVEGKSKTIDVLVLPDTTAPPQVDGFAVNVVGNTSIEIFWRTSTAPDISYYDVRYTPLTDAPTWNFTTSLVKASYETSRTTVGARTGSYGIVAVDTSGNKSNPVFLRTSVEDLPNLNIIQSIDDAPDWLGKKVDMVTNIGPSPASTMDYWDPLDWADPLWRRAGPGVPSGLKLAGDFGAVVPKGTYYFQDTIDLGNIEEVRLQAKMLAYGTTENETMQYWEPLSAANPLSPATADDWDAWMEVRTSDLVPTMSTWVPSISVADPLNSTGQNWQPWRRFESADVTGRIFQFRMNVVSNDVNVNAIVLSSNVEVDVLDRTISVPDVVVTDAALGKVVNFNPMFRETPAIAVTIDGNAAAVTYETSNKSAGDVTIRLVDSATGNFTTGQFDLLAQGYGKRRTSPL